VVCATSSACGIYSELAKLNSECRRASGEKREDLKRTILDTFTEVTHEVREVPNLQDFELSTAVRLLAESVEVVNRATFEFSFSELSEKDQFYARNIFGNSINYDNVWIKAGGSISDIDGLAARSVGGVLYLPSKYVALEYCGEYILSKQHVHTFGHEMGHVWQHQNGGADYAHIALAYQAHARITTGDRNNAYRGAEALENGTRFENLNPEEQADVIDHIGRIWGANLIDSKLPIYTYSGVWQAAHQSIKQGKGAP